MEGIANEVLGRITDAIRLLVLPIRVARYVIDCFRSTLFLIHSLFSNGTIFLLFIGGIVGVRFLNTPVVVLYTHVPSPGQQAAQKKLGAAVESVEVKRKNVQKDLEPIIGRRFSRSRFALQLVCLWDSTKTYRIRMRLSALMNRDHVFQSNEDTNTSRQALTLEDRSEVTRAVSNDRRLRDAIFQCIMSSVVDGVMMREHYQSVIPLQHADVLVAIDWWSYAELYACYLDCRSVENKPSFWNSCQNWCSDVMRIVKASLFDSEEAPPKLSHPCHVVSRDHTLWTWCDSVHVIFPKGFPEEDYSASVVDLIIESVLIHQQSVAFVRSKNFLPRRDMCIGFSTADANDIVRALRAITPPTYPLVSTGFSFGATVLHNYLNSMADDSIKGFNTHVTESGVSKSEKGRELAIVLAGTRSNESSDAHCFFKQLGSEYYYSCNQCLVDLWVQNAISVTPSSTDLRNDGDPTCVVFLGVWDIQEGLSPLSSVALISPIFHQDINYGCYGSSFFKMRDGGFWYRLKIPLIEKAANEWRSNVKMLACRNKEVSEVGLMDPLDGALQMSFNTEKMSKWDVAEMSNPSNDDSVNHGATSEDLVATSVFYECHQCHARVKVSECDYNDEPDIVLQVLKAIVDCYKITPRSSTSCPVLIIVSEDDMICSPRSYQIDSLLSGGSVTMAITPHGHHADFWQDLYSTKMWTSRTAMVFLQSMIEI
eukprot:GHVH01005453.1.p1 GENE.GHVH01005453.1~~GHVH01005453.1.p1  ORF type:complete len:709 (+),score=75.94 GHVH01005453.1:1219-3345(+)